jgi:hypothetical protein
MTPEQRMAALLWKRATREAKAARRAFALTVTCPDCGEPAGLACIGAGGQLRASPHAARMDRARRLLR